MPQTTSSSDLSAQERQVLADAMLAAGPDAPTLCEGWTVQDLAVHLVLRERRPDTVPGAFLPGFSRWTRHVHDAARREPLADLVARFRSGPPVWSAFAIPGVDGLANLGEHFVHAEDVLRGDPAATPRTLSPELDAALWGTLVSRGRMLLGRVPTGVVLVTPDGRRHVAKGGTPAVTLTGEPGDLVLYAFGRKGAARVEVSGDDDALERFGAAKLGF